MLNITITSLNILSLLSISPLYTIKNSYERLPRISFYNSHFSNSFTNIITSYTNNHKTSIKNSAFSFMLDSPIKFTSESDINQFTPFNPNCSFDANQPIGGKHLNGENLGKEHNIFFVHDCGDILITGCIFNNCYSNGPGGSIFILQNCSAIIHNTIFNSSHTTNNTGGAVFAAVNIYNTNENFDNKQINQLDIQYCCFQNCCSTNGSPLFGVAVFSAAVNNILYYASTVKCPGKNGTRATGAQFDLQGHNVSSKFVNSTGGNSDFCGGIEYRHASNGFFRFQTISDMECMFSVAYTDIKDNEIELSLSNIVNVTLRRSEKMNDESVFCGLIHIRDTHEISIVDFSFIDNKMDETIFYKEINGNKTEYTDYARIISRGTYNGHLQNMTIYLINCSYNCPNDKVIYNCSITIKNCNSEANSSDLNDILQLDLGECKGNVTAKPLTPTQQFTDSQYFTNSNHFIETEGFTKTNEFSYTNDFTRSELFSKSNEFTKSNQFTHTSLYVNIIDTNSDKTNNVNVGMIAGIAAGVAGAAAAATAVAIFFIKKRPIGAPVEAETVNNTNNTVNNENPLYSREAEDDPFKDDFAV